MTVRDLRDASIRHLPSSLEGRTHDNAPGLDIRLCQYQVEDAAAIAISMPGAASGWDAPATGGKLRKSGC